MTSRNWKADVEAIRKILLTDWAPIGADVPDDEYDGYIGGIYGRMQRGATVEELAQHLDSIESDAMGLTINQKVTIRNLEVSRALLALLD
jgi:hypothetical protein